MKRKLVLPVASSTKTPTVDAVRKRLGGRASSESGAGDLVAFADERGVERFGVVVFAAKGEVDVWTTTGFVRHMKRDAARAADAAVPTELEAVGVAARTFASLTEGQAVTFRIGEREDSGLLIEKCRFGALVERGDGSIVGVGFSRLTASNAKGEPQINASGSTEN